MGASEEINYKPKVYGVKSRAPWVMPNVRTALEYQRWHAQKFFWER
jgi:hypothetical protein